MIQALLQRGFFLVHTLEHPGDQAKLRAHARTDDHAAPASVGDHCSHEGSILAVTQWDILFQFHGGILLGRLRFAGQCGFVDL